MNNNNNNNNMIERIQNVVPFLTVSLPSSLDRYTSLLE